MVTGDMKFKKSAMLKMVTESQNYQADLEDLIDEHLETWYNHAIKYMCQKQIQSWSHIEILTSKAKRVRILYNKLDAKKRKKIVEYIGAALKNGVLHDAIERTRQEAIDAKKNFTDHMDPDMIMTEFPPETILSLGKTDEFLKKHAVHYDVRKKLNLPAKRSDFGKVVSAEILPKDA